MNICEHLTETAKLVPDREALVFGGQSLSYGRLDQLSRAAAARLAAAGIRRGDRVAIMLPNVPAFVVWYYAALRLGAVAVSISTRLTGGEVALVVADCDAKALVADRASMAQVRNAGPDRVAVPLETSELGDACDGVAFDAGPSAPGSWIETAPDEAALILYTSGTTGFAKGATLSHRNVRSNVHAFNRLCQMQSEDRILLAVPLFHCFGQNALLNSGFNVGATLVLQRKFDPHESKRLIADEKVTQLYGVPTMFQLLHESCQPPDLATVNYCFSAAATLPLQVSRNWQGKFKIPIHEGYGLTETSPFASYNHQSHHVLGSIGTPIDSVEMKIVDSQTGQTCPPGQLGEIAIRGPNVMLGYWNRPAETAHAIRDGWFHSGDVGRMDEAGYFYIVDRVKDMIAVGGTKVFPAEVERILLDHQGVSQVAVVGFPDDLFGEQVVAFVVSAGADATDQLAAEIKQHARQNLANYKVPKQIVFVDELPRNPSGKVLKTKLRAYDFRPAAAIDQSGGEVAVAANPPWREPTLRQQLAATHAAGRQRVADAFVQQLVQAVTGADELPEPDCRFLDAGLDSLMVVGLSSQIQVEVGPQQEVPATLVFEHPRICDLSQFLLETLAPEQVSESTAGPLAGSHPTHTAGTPDLLDQVERMTEAEVLAELMKEIEN